MKHVLSDNPLLSSIQDMIKEKFDLESQPSLRAQLDSSYDYRGGDWIDVNVFGEESYVFTIGVVDDKLIIYRPGYDVFTRDKAISLYNENFLEWLWESIEYVISKLNISE